MSLARRVAGALSHAYPPSFRERYGEEYAALLDDMELGWRQVLDVGLGVLGAWLRPMRPQGDARLRSTTRTAFVAWVLMCLAGAGFQKTVEDAPFSLAQAAHPVLAFAKTSLVVLASLAALAFACGALPLFLEAVRLSLRRSRSRLGWLIMIPPASVVVWAVGTWGFARLVGGRQRPVNALDLVALHPYLLFSVACVVVFGLATLVALRRIHPTRSLLARGMWPAAVLGFLMAGATVCGAWYSVALVLVSPYIAREWSGPLGVSVYVNLAVAVGIMAVATGIALTSGLRGLRAVRFASEQFSPPGI